MFMVYDARKLRIMNPAPESSTSVRISSLTTKVAVQRPACDPPMPLRPLSFNTSLRSVFDTCSDGAHAREQHAFDQQLPDDPPPRRAERRPHRHLARAADRSRELQVRDIRAGDEEDEAHGAEHGEKQRAYRPLGRVVVVGAQVRL